MQTESILSVNNWLMQLVPTRANSCPPSLNCRNPPDLIFHQEPVSEARTQSHEQGSSGSTRSSRPAISQPNYRSILRNNGVYIDYTGEKVPQQLRDFLDSDILKRRSTSISPQKITEVVNTAIAIAESPETYVYDLVGTTILPVKRFDVGRGSNTPWHTYTLPRKEHYHTPIMQPKPDLHYGYLTGQSSTWTIEENSIIDHPHMRPTTQPTKSNSFPFLVIEMKSEAMGGNIWQAENQVAGSGACCMNALRHLFQQAHTSRDQSVVDSIAFSVCLTYREAVLYVHYYSVEEDCHWMSWINTYQTIRDIEECNNSIENIFEYALGTRQKRIRDTLERLYPFPEHWRDTQPAPTMESGILTADNEVSTSRKRRRSE
ncbi:hypothetical protein TEQG_01789 [Trichophyton equinum CBS 127.97]|uniref:DUF7924 domain-containing protein n=1 Tax=Trichophyton equinum (strain ATCC MYA-4606 / CBS 127.97) TaxID=559882 RepID=F2PLF4_TRIEC|nr:hypothetical protein TEQG_01789 [Trichophyton equinum CBS 127.97]